MIFANFRTNIDGSLKTKKELFIDSGVEIEKVMDAHPYAVVALTCIPVHLACHYVLHLAVKP